MSILQSKATNSALTGLFRINLAAFIILALYFGKSLLIPFALAILLAFILSPLVDRMERYIGRTLGISVACLVLFSIITASTILLFQQLTVLGNELPKYKTNIEKRLNYLDPSQNNSFAQLFQSIEMLQKHLPTSPHSSANQSQKSDSVKVMEPSSSNLNAVIKDSVLALFDFIATIGLVFILAIFMLFTREDLRGRLIKLIGPTRISSTTMAINDASRRVTQYLISQVVINLFYGVVVAIGLSFVGLPNAILWGSLAFLLRFIPYVGIWVAAVLPFMVALAVFPGWVLPLVVFTLFVGLDLVTANIIEPILFASRTGISSLALILTAVFWTLVWGPVGLFLSTPLTACILVVAQHLPQLSYLHTLLGDDKGISLYEKFYRNLTSLDFKRAGLLIHNHLKKGSLAELYESTVLPVLSAAEIDKRNKLYDAERINKVFSNLTSMLEKIPDQLSLDRKRKNEHTLSNVNALCIPASTERDLIASNMLMQVLNDSLFTASQVADDLHLKNVVNYILNQQIDIVCISAVAPHLTQPAIRWTESLRAHFPDLKIVIGLWGNGEKQTDVEEELKKAGADVVVYSFRQVLGEFGKASEVKV